MTDNDEDLPDLDDINSVGGEPVPAPGGDPDSRKRELKTRLATAEMSGDVDTADALRDDLDAVNDELDVGSNNDELAAAAKRRQAAADAGSGTQTSAPQGRAAPTKATTAAKAATTGTKPPAATN